MEVRALAERILSSSPIEEKIAPPDDALTDQKPGPPVFWSFPARPEGLEVRTRKTRVEMPRPGGMQSEQARGQMLHFFANHELQALEIMAFALLAYPDTPPAFRQGLVGTLTDEARHLGLYLHRMKKMGIRFGELPIQDYFWSQVKNLQTPVQYLAALPLTFEGANLDHLPYYEDHFRQVGDTETADLLAEIHRDELRHVHFGVEWLRELKPTEATEWETYQEALTWPMRPLRARGKVYRREDRLRAGMSESFVNHLEVSFEK